MSYSQALLLMGIPEEEREEFVRSHNIQSMSIRELSQAIKEQSGAGAEKTQAQSSPGLNAPQNLKREYVSVNKSLKLTNMPPPKPLTPEAQESLKEYEEKCFACRKAIADAFSELLKALTQLNRIDPEVKEKCRKEAVKLAEGMLDMLKEWPPIPKFYVQGVSKAKSP